MKFTLGLKNIFGILAILSCIQIGTAASAQLLQNGQDQPVQNRGMLGQQPSSPLLNAAGGGCTINQLQLMFRTGHDDLRGGSNNLNVEIHYANGTIQTAKNVNQGANWPNNSLREVPIALNHPVAANQIKSINLIHLAQGGYDGTALALGSSGTGIILPTPDMAATGIKTEDNWDMAEMNAFSVVGAGTKVVIASSGDHVFTGTKPAFSVNAVPNIACPSAGQVTELHLVFQTGNDDLRGGNDNLNVAIVGDGFNQQEMNVNRSQRWADGTGQEVTVLLNKPMMISQLRKLVLEATYGAPSGGSGLSGVGTVSNDKWNMDSLKVYAMVNGKNQLIGSQGFYRFTAPPGNRLTVNLQ